jgi:hypothetical protein
LDFDDFLKIEGCKTGKHLFAKKARLGAACIICLSSIWRRILIMHIQAPGGEIVKCRIDHYQTPGEVHVTVYAKKADKEKSSISFDTDQARIDFTNYSPARRFIYVAPIRFTSIWYFPVPSNSCRHSICMDPSNQQRRHSRSLGRRFVPNCFLIVWNNFHSLRISSRFLHVISAKVDLLLTKSDARSWNMLERPADESILPQGFSLTFGVGGRTGTVGGKEIILDDSNKLAKAPAAAP